MPIRISSKRPTTGRMTRHLKLRGLTPTQHGEWCGLTLKEWIANNPGWNERDWVALIEENAERIASIERNAENRRDNLAITAVGA